MHQFIVRMLKCFGVLTIFVGVVYGDVGYSYPQPPLQFDEISSPPPIYLPPPQEDFPQIIPTYLPPSVVYPPLGSPPQEDIPPFDDGIVIPSPPNNQYLPAATRQTPLQVFNMSCLDSRNGNGYFRTFLRSTGQSRAFPVIETSSPDCTVTPITSDTFRVDLDGQRMVNCGVRSCGTRMCVTLRMATIQGLRVADDPLVTLQCIPQETVVSHVKHLRLNANTDQARSLTRSVAVASGGSQRRFETQMSLLRKSSGSDIFDQPVQQGSAVRLGDELLLRTSVRDGDGWRFSRMGAVVVRSAASQRSITLVDEDGCRIPAMRSISPLQPQQISPLVVQLPFRAFLFQGSAPADDLFLSVRMSACLRSNDCYQSRNCEDVRSRIRRSVENSTEGNETEIISESEFQFRVLPRDVPLETHKTNFFDLNFVSLIFSVSLSGLLLCAIFLLIKPIKQRISDSYY